MTDTELITAAIKHWLNVGSAETVQDTDFQERGGLHATQAVEEFWLKPWHWKDASASVTIASTGIGPLPADFGNITRGFVIDGTTKVKLQYVDPQTLFRLRASTTGSGNPQFYTIAGMDAAADPMVKRIHVYPKPAANRSVTVYYEMIRPVIVWDGEGLQSVPAEYHRSVILIGTIAKFADDEGDPRAPKYDGDFRRAIAMAWNESKQGLQEPKRRRAYGGNRWY